MSVMLMRKYSEVYPSRRNPHHGYRYDYEHNVLERVTKCDSYISASGSLINLLFMDWVVVDSVALTREEWDVAPQYWVDFYTGDIKEGNNIERGNLWNIFRIKKPDFGLKAVS